MQDNATGQYLAPVKTITFTTDQCSFTTSAPVSQTIKSVSTIEANTAKLKIRPVPAKNYIIVEGADEGLGYRIYNLSGELVKSGVGNKVNIEKMQPGMYILKTHNNQVLRVVKE